MESLISVFPLRAYGLQYFIFSMILLTHHCRCCYCNLLKGFTQGIFFENQDFFVTLCWLPALKVYKLSRSQMYAQVYQISTPEGLDLSFDQDPYYMTSDLEDSEVF